MPNTYTISNLKIQVIIGDLDVTEYVIGGNVQRNLGSAIGKWTINLRPIVKNGAVCDLPIAINDYCEIRVGRELGPNQKPPILMRGMVDGISLTDSANQDRSGGVGRSVTIGGSDFGKIFDRRKIIVPPDLYTETAQQAYKEMAFLYWTIYQKWAAETGTPQNDASITSMGLTQWIERFYLLISDSSPNTDKVKITSLIDIPKNSSSGGEDRLQVFINPIIVPNEGGSLWDYVTFYCKRPFFELFIEDKEDESVFKVRWTPYQQADGGYPVQESLKLPWFQYNPEELTINYDQVLSQDFRRNDFDRYTYFFTRIDGFWAKTFQSSTSPGPVPVSTVDTEASKKQAESIEEARAKQGLAYKLTANQDLPAYGTHANPYYDGAGINQFGYKPMVTTLPFFGKLETDSLEAVATLLRDVNKWLVDVFSFTDLLYNGLIVFIGNPKIKVGQWIILNNNKVYVEAVEHSFQIFPAPSFVTRVTFTRGHGYPNVSNGARTASKEMFKTTGTKPNLNRFGNPLLRNK